MVSPDVWDVEAQVRFLPPRPSFRPISIMALHLFCNQATAVRFCHGAPSFCAGLTLRVGFEAKRRQV